MPACNVEVIKFLGKYLNTSVGPVSLNTDKVLTTVIDKQNVEGFVSIILMLSSKSGLQLSREQVPLVYQWLEHLPLYADQAVANQTFAKTFLQDINKWLQKNTYLVGQSLSIADVVAYYVLYPLLERLSILEKESLLYICRWSRHIQAQPRVCSSRPALPLNTLTLSILAPAEAKPFLSLPLPEQILPHQLKTVSLERPVLYYPQPFAYPSYPVVLYVR